METEAPADNETPKLCVLCGEFGAASGCAGGHILCRPCAVACTRMTEKILGPSEIPPLCPLPDCTEFLRADRPVGPPKRLARLIRLKGDDPEYGEILNAFGATMDAGKVHDIFRVENPALKAVHEACRERMERSGRRRRGGKEVGANEKRLFHATTRAAAGSIVREGFDAHRAGQAHGAALGPGIYVATDASFSHGYSSEDSVGTRAMFVCSVLLGDTSGRDSRSDGAARPSQYAVHREQQVLPTHLLYYAA